MTPEEHRELDAKVHEALYGEGWNGGNPIKGFEGRWPWPYPYSTDIAAAWLVVEKLRGRWPVEIMTPAPGGYSCLVGGLFAMGNGATAPLAICLAALEALKAK